MKTRIRQICTDSLSCEPILRKMPSGDLLCVVQCGDVTEPAPGNRVYYFRSNDQGETWSERQLIRPEDGKAVYATEVSVIDNKIIVYLTIHNGRFGNWKSERMMSTDNAQSWQSIGPLPGYETFTFPRGMIRLSDGTLCMACQHYPISETENERLISENLKVWEANVSNEDNDLLFSSDEGENWTAIHGPAVSMLRDGKKKWVWNEPTIVELKNGNIGMLLRMDGTGRLFYAEMSTDGRIIQEPTATDIPNPSNKPKLIRLQDGRIALIHTPNDKLGFSGRTPLSVWISHDEMKSFDEKHIVTDFPGAYHYPDGYAEKDHLFFSIEHNRHTVLFIDMQL